MKHFWYKLLVKGFAVGIFSTVLVHSIYAFGQQNEGIQIYQKNTRLSAEHKQKIAATIDRYKNADNLWDVLREEFSLPHYEDNPRVQEQINWFMNNQDFLYRSASRSAPYLYYILQQIRKRHLPAEVALIPIFESSYNPFASSPVGAAGIWQMMPSTASGYGIKQTWWYDGRRDVIASTKAALNYLTYLGDFFDGNWLYAVAAYDTGEGNLLSAIKKNISYGYTTDYWSLPVAQETRDYIPKLLALATIISHPDEYPVQLPYVRNAPYLAQVDVGAQIDLQHAAQLAGLSYQELKVLNPGYSRNATDPNGPFKIVLPIEHVEEFTENLANSSLAQRSTSVNHKKQHDDTLTMIALHSNKNALKVRARLQQFVSRSVLSHLHGRYTLQPGDTLYMVRNGDNIEKIANHYHTTADTIRIANNVKKNHIVSVGEKLIIPTHKITNTEKKRALSPGDTLYMVRRGDTIEKIAKKYHTNTAMLRVANLMTTKEIKEGDALIIPTQTS